MSQRVKDYYDKHSMQESQRLDNPLSRIEFASTLHLIDCYFPKKGRVADIGSGPGRYAMELIRRGHAVTVFDLSEASVRLAEANLTEAGLEAESYIVGDARNISGFGTESFDAALLLGPLYHIVDAEERASVLEEVRRVLKPGGILIAAYLNAWGILRTGVEDFPNWYRNIDTLRSFLNEQVFAGSRLSGFTDCYWSIPDVALAEVAEGGFEIISYAGAESFCGGMQTLINELASKDPEAYANVVTVAAESCELAQYRDGTDHLHIVARKSET